MGGPVFPVSPCFPPVFPVFLCFPLFSSVFPNRDVAAFFSRPNQRPTSSRNLGAARFPRCPRSPGTDHLRRALHTRLSNEQLVALFSVIGGPVFCALHTRLSNEQLVALFSAVFCAVFLLVALFSYCFLTVFFRSTAPCRLMECGTGYGTDSNSPCHTVTACPPSTTRSPRTRT